jgi:hypothetical protein
MYFKLILIPLFAQVLLTFIVLFTMARQRVSELKTRQIDPQKVDIRSRTQDVFQKAAAASDNFQNQFETPVLFYVAILLSMVLLIQDGVVVVMAWTYVVLRYVHCFIHLTYNSVMHRFAVFLLSVIALLTIWVRLGWLIIY